MGNRPEQPLAKQKTMTTARRVLPMTDLPLYAGVVFALDAANVPAQWASFKKTVDDANRVGHHA